MPRYFFDTCDGERLVADSEGMELTSLEAAKLEAQRTSAEIARDALQGDDHRTCRVIVRDDAGQVLLRVALTLVVEHGPGA